MSDSEPNFKAFNNFNVDDLDPEASVSQRMLQLLEDIDNGQTVGPKSAAGRAALASSVVAHAVTELENQLIELRRKLATASPRQG